ncbi:hypothetical protein F5X98DRAFT_332216 [Xylaria grammica]|nr:hypothetical protein F5X98DRAFT_332216 [Xylaria grammica]
MYLRRLSIVSICAFCLLPFCLSFAFLTQCIRLLVRSLIYPLFPLLTPVLRPNTQRVPFATHIYNYCYINSLLPVIASGTVATVALTHGTMSCAWGGIDESGSRQCCSYLDGSITRCYYRCTWPRR